MDKSDIHWVILERKVRARQAQAITKKNKNFFERKKNSFHIFSLRGFLHSIRNGSPLNKNNSKVK